MGFQPELWPLRGKWGTLSMTLSVGGTLPPSSVLPSSHSSGLSNFEKTGLLPVYCGGVIVSEMDLG